jgi:carboxylate-amine ligase
LESWDEYTGYVDYLKRSGIIDTLGEIWWDVRLHPGLDTVEIRAFDAQTDLARNEALVAFAAALCDMLGAEHEAGKPGGPILPNREVEENKWSAQRYGLEGVFIDHTTHEAIETRRAIRDLVSRLSGITDRDLSGLRTLVEKQTESVRQLEVWRETGSTLEVARDLAQRTRASAGYTPG